MRKIQIYASNHEHAAELAATMNLKLRHWEWTGESEWVGITWANVGDVLEEVD